MTGEGRSRSSVLWECTCPTGYIHSGTEQRCDGCGKEQPGRSRSPLHEAVESAGRCMSAHPRDWGTDGRDAWLYGLICGWDCDNDQHDHDEECTSAMTEVAERFGWSAKEVARLRRLRRAMLASATASGQT